MARLGKMVSPERMPHPIRCFFSQKLIFLHFCHHCSSQNRKISASLAHRRHLDRQVVVAFFAEMENAHCATNNNKLLQEKPGPKDHGEKGGRMASKDLPEQRLVENRGGKAGNCHLFDRVPRVLLDHQDPPANRDQMVGLFYNCQ